MITNASIWHSENIAEFLFHWLKKYPCSLVFLRNIRGENELTLGRSEPIRRLVIYERAVKQTPSCLGSLVNPRIAYIPSRFIAARPFFFPPLLSRSFSLFLS